MDSFSFGKLLVTLLVIDIGFIFYFVKRENEELKMYLASGIGIFLILFIIWVYIRAISIVLGIVVVVYFVFLAYKEEDKSQEKCDRKKETLEKEKRMKKEDPLRKEIIREEEQRKRHNEQFRKEQERKKAQEKLIPHIIKKREIDKDQKISEAGDPGEKILADVFESHGNLKGCYWWLNKRVKLQLGKDKGPSEIDLIVVSHNYIYIFESKYFRGYLVKNPNELDTKNPWIRIKPAYDAEGRVSNDEITTKPIENLILPLEIKLEKLKNILAGKNINIPSDKFKYKVIFTHKNFKIDEGIKEIDGLISINDIESYLDLDKSDINDTDEFLIGLIRYIIFNEKKKSKYMPNVLGTSKNLLTSNIELLEVINSLPSWDSITFYGGKTIRGDVLKIRNIFFDQSNLDFLNSTCDLEIKSKRTFQAIQLDWDNGKNQLIEIYYSEGQLHGFKDINYLHPKIKFHQVGKKLPSEFYIYEIKKISLRGLYCPKIEK